MKDVIYLLFHLLRTLAKLATTRWRPFSHRREPTAETTTDHPQQVPPTAPNLTTQDRTLLGFISLFLNPRRIARAAIHHQAIYPALFSQRTEETESTGYSIHRVAARSQVQRVHPEKSSMLSLR